MKALLKQAGRLLENAYVPYSHKAAVAVVRTKGGHLYAGVTVENAAYKVLHAVDVAIGHMVSDGSWCDEKGSLQQISDILIVSNQTPPRIPSGQSLAHLRFFSTDTAAFYLASPEKIQEVCALKELLPLIPPRPLTEKFRAAAENYERKAGLPVEDERMKWIRRAMKNAFAPFSYYKVGTMIRAESGEIFLGCNIETEDNYAIYAEEVAVGNMVTRLGRNAKIAEVVVMGGKIDEPEAIRYFPAGHSLQLIEEFSTSDTLINCANPEKINNRDRQRHLLPRPFSPNIFAPLSLHPPALTI